MAHPEVLPDTATVGESGHTDDHNTIVTAVRNIDDRLDIVETSGGGGDVSAHVGDISGAHAASAISVIDEFGYSSATNVQDVLDDLDAGIASVAVTAVAANNAIDAHVGDTSGAHLASAIATSGHTGNLSGATDVEAALDLIDDLAIGGGSLSSQSAGTAFGRALGAGSGTPGSLTARQVASIVQSADSVFNVKDAQYGATGDGSTDDTAAINLAIVALNATSKGGVLFFPPGTYKVTAGLTAITKPAQILGGGGRPTRYLLTETSTTILQTSKTAHTLTLSADGCTVDGLLFWNSTYGDGAAITGAWPQTLRTTALPTAGSGIRVYDAGKPDGVKRATIRNCDFYGFYRNVDLSNSLEARLVDNCFVAPVLENVRCANPAWYDAGSTYITQNEFMTFEAYSIPETHIKWESGGGLNIGPNNTFVSGIYTTTGDGISGDVRYAIHIDNRFANSTGANAVTTDFKIIGNHIESHGRSGGAAIFIETANEAADVAMIGRIIIVGNYMNTFQQQTASHDGVRITGSTSHNTKQINVSGNTMLGGNNFGGAATGISTGHGVKLTRVTNAIVNNSVEAFAGAMSKTSCADVTGMFKRTVDYSIGKVLVAETDVFRWYNKTGKTLHIDQVFFTLGTVGTVSTSSPISGKAVVMDVNKNGTTIFTTQANRPAVSTSANLSSTTAPDVTTLADGDYLTFDVDFVGAAGGAAYAVITVEMSA